MKNVERISLLAIGLLLLLLPAGQAQDNTRLGGYGELHFNKPTDGVPAEDLSGTLDFHRFVLFVGHQFSDWVWFYSELEVEHTFVKGGENTGEVALEQAYIQLQYAPAFGLRAGIMLVPVGIANPIHEPPTFNGVERPNVERYIIPSTWREAGIGAVGKWGQRFKYEAYLMAGLDPNGLDGKNGIRGARQKAFESSTADVAVTARLDYSPLLNTTLGVSGFYSTLDGGTGDSVKDANFWMFSAHALFSRGNFQARGLAVYSGIGEIEALNRYLAEDGESTSDIGERQLGAYAEMGYDIWGLLRPESEQRVFAFARLERYDTHAATRMISQNPAFERSETTVGLTYLPDPQVSLKLDYQFLNTGADNDRQQFNLGVGYNF